MKTIRNKISAVILACVITIIIGSCSDDFLNRYPLNELTEETAFVTYENFKTYSWGFYNRLGGFSTGSDDDLYSTTHNDNECNSDNFNKCTGSLNDYKYQTKKEPSTNPVYTDAYSAIRRVNIMLQNIDGSAMSETEKNHWRSVGLFFRSMEYYTLLSNFGDVAWIDKVIGDSDKDVYLGKRTPRDEVAKNILTDLQYAEQHINENGDGNNTINVHVIRAMLSRFGLFEGTWRKYHGLSDSETYLKASTDASEKLISNFPNVMASYDDLYNSEDLLVGESTGVLLARKYSNVVTNGAHSIGRVIRTSAWYYELTRDAVDAYLCTNGKPVSTIEGFSEYDMFQEFRDRDRRLYYTVVPPYKVKVIGTTDWEYTDVPKEREYIDMMKTITSETGKYLPTTNFAGSVCYVSPHFKGDVQGFLVGYLGYYYWKYYNRHEDGMALRSSTQNYPVFRMGEVLVNHAEAMYELGRFDQTVANKTINVLRKRANIPDMIINDISANFDPARDQDVNPVLWEIRRERRVELMGDGFRFNDLKRWKKGSYLNNPKVYYGVRVKKSDYNNHPLILNDQPEGNAVFIHTAALGWLDHYYLEPIPIKEQVLNPNLEQNPGWKDYRGSELE